MVSSHCVATEMWCTLPEKKPLRHRRRIHAVVSSEKLVGGIDNLSPEKKAKVYSSIPYRAEVRYNEPRYNGFWMTWTLIVTKEHLNQHQYFKPAAHKW